MARPKKRLQPKTQAIDFNNSGAYVCKLKSLIKLGSPSMGLYYSTFYAYREIILSLLIII